ncbi:Holliday junction ATP-dependent DNA helicase [Actinidia chinensis var. chinensis]|uniref:Holliday junction ATP-dependent DNA helicase n=1 Tax=Actinidia chinensis var. chinensis TaxID=1590841 RepID=A0A2R6R252_ACTCC|nr:Holliday junction ATP-dependent DNA helicase [Actinidia chinensis var. chinensis]
MLKHERECVSKKKMLHILQRFAFTKGVCVCVRARAHTKFKKENVAIFTHTFIYFRLTAALSAISPPLLELEVGHHKGFSCPSKTSSRPFTKTRVSMKVSMHNGCLPLIPVSVIVWALGS